MGTQTSTRDAADRQLRFYLTELMRRLEQIESVVSVAAAALRHQNCEKDVDVARVLQRDVGDRLSVEGEKIAALLRTLETSHKRQVKSLAKTRRPART